MDTEEKLDNFGSLLIKSVRDYTIHQMFALLEGRAKAPALIKLSEELKNVTAEEAKSMKKLIITSIDNAISNFLWMIEQNEEIDLLYYDKRGSSKNRDSLREMSDGLCGDYAGFIEDKSQYPSLEI